MPDTRYQVTQEQSSSAPPSPGTTTSSRRQGLLEARTEQEKWLGYLRQKQSGSTNPAQWSGQIAETLREIDRLAAEIEKIDAGTTRIPPRPSGPVPRGHKREFNATTGEWEDTPLDVPTDKAIPPRPGGSVPRGYSLQFNDDPDVWAWEYVPLGLEGVSSGSTSSPSAMMAAQEQAASGQFERQTKFPWEKEKWEKDYEFDTGTKFPFEVRKHEETQQYNQAKLAQDKLLAEMADRENWRRAQLSTATGLYDTNANVFTKMAAAAPLPGQQYHLGYEPGGTMENIAQMSGRTYNPEQYRIAVQNYDPEEWWRRAQAMASSQGR